MCIVCFLRCVLQKPLSTSPLGPTVTVEDCGRETIEGRVSLPFVNEMMKYEAMGQESHKEDEKDDPSWEWHIVYTNTQSNSYRPSFGRVT